MPGVILPVVGRLNGRFGGKFSSRPLWMRCRIQTPYKWSPCPLCMGSDRSGKKPPSVVADAVMPLKWAWVTCDPTSELSINATVNNAARPNQM